MTDEEVRQFRIHHASMVYQDPGAALNPSTKIGPQVAEAFTVLGQSKKQAKESALQALDRVQIADPEAVAAALPAPAVGRDAAARRHRHRAGVGPEAAGPRRADDRARRHGRGERARPRPLAPGGDERRGPADRPQPRRHPDDVRPGRGDVRRQDRRGGRRRGGLRAPEAPVHARAPALAPAARHPQDRAGAVDDPGQPAADRHGPADLRLRRSLPAGRRAVPDGRPAGRRGRATVAGRAATTSTGSASWSSRRRSSARTPSTATWPCPSRTCRRPSTRAATTCRRWSRSNLELFDGETLGLVGESGSGKSTLAKTILGIESPDAGGNIELDEHALAARSTGRPTDDKRSIQMVFQNPDSALNRGWTARHILQRSVSKLTGLKGKAVNERVDKLAADLRLTQRHLDLKPRQLSGGLKQRAGDRPGVRRRPADRRRRRADQRARRLGPGRDPQPAVRAAAQEPDQLPADLARPRRGALPRRPDRGASTSAGSWRSAIPRPSSAARTTRTPRRCCRRSRTSTARIARRILLEGEIPSPANPPTGCVFNTRCHRAIRGLCEVTEPPLVEVEPGHLMSCHIPLEELRILQRRRTTEGAGDVEAAVAKAAETTGQSVEELAEAVQEAEAAGTVAAEADAQSSDSDRPPDPQAPTAG